MAYLEKYNSWMKSAFIDEMTKKELQAIKDEKEIEDRFYKELEFGTGGLRGIIGAGTNRMNIYTVSKASQGFANFLNSNYNKPSVAIAYDSRNMSIEFAMATALTLCANGVKVYLYESLRPTPMLSFAVRELKCSGGVVITASHNPKEYNGYKVYGPDGGQVTDNDAKSILSFINKVADFKDVKSISEEKALAEGLLEIIGEDIDKRYIENVKALSIQKDLIRDRASELKVIYTPIHGTGNIPVRRVLKELGYTNVEVVKEQELPDGNFPSAPYPNPEDPKVFAIALDMAKTYNPDIIFGTDPDCDRIGVVVKDRAGEFKVLTGNQTGILLTNYILKSLKETNSLPENGVVIKTIVTSEGAKKIAEKFNVELQDVLTGFKYIGEKIKEFEENSDKKYIFGFEESYGYLYGTYARDKDAVVAAAMICEMALYYKTKGISLYEALLDLYEEYGCFKETLVSIELKGKDGQEKIASCIEYLRHSMKTTIGDCRIVSKLDYKLGIEKNLITFKEHAINLPKSNVLKFILEDGSWFVVRPSGTEPKMKIYIAVVGKDIEDSEDKMNKFKEKITKIIDESLK
ncbi:MULTISPECIES: phospho-sugar mutase [Clostridium]|uniref:Phosphoglucomutase n=1 Tax=Clostridium cadaveris TaxID=1529 RepID=A0A1I2J8T4_9CLOT|nr:phospho-sugar mutase [Clostridium cadaveris]MDU4951491.1 phospho-sugar mutase [Clostridium sp.]MDM8312487.1 phospho-sugar mutase [Clostridium cadaveris]MDY4948037.1 phospho-sugar mutase [Clostridium cadaveris]NME63218.1 phospho-sugar mutase [Clostridium cadaveris]SFF49336.1 phosphoglucomutase [Clostridium cadaveris]